MSGNIVELPSSLHLFHLNTKSSPAHQPGPQKNALKLPLGHLGASGLDHRSGVLTLSRPTTSHHLLLGTLSRCFSSKNPSKKQAALLLLLVGPTSGLKSPEPPVKACSYGKIIPFHPFTRLESLLIPNGIRPKIEGTKKKLARKPWISLDKLRNPKKPLENKRKNLNLLSACDRASRMALGCERELKGCLKRVLCWFLGTFWDV